MKKFGYIRPGSVAEVLPLLSDTARPLAGGTSLLTEMEDGLTAPERLISLRDVAELRGIASTGEHVQVGALATLADLSRNTMLREGPLAALAEAARLAASPQIRTSATIGGNLLQDVRCWYYRSGVPCWLAGGSGCPARTGEHHMHALFEQSPCAAVHPSDPATVLLALDAQVVIAGGASGEQSLPLADLLAAPTAERRRMHTLPTDALIVRVDVPAHTGWRSIYQKAMERSLFAWALAGVAVAIRFDGETVTDARIALGGVANTPMLASDAAEMLVGQPLTNAQIQAAARRATEGAEPLPQTGYKLTLVQRLVAEALRQLRDQ